jgi:hypothetical protein
VEAAAQLPETNLIRSGDSKMISGLSRYSVTVPLISTLLFLKRCKSPNLPRLSGKIAAVNGQFRPEPSRSMDATAGRIVTCATFPVTIIDSS